MIWRAFLLVQFAACIVNRSTALVVQKRADDHDPLENVVAQLSADLLSEKASLAALKAKVDRMDENVAFRVGVHAESLTGLTHNLVVKFPDVYLNIGHGYKQATGYFEAPIAGTYAFFLRLQNHPGDRVHMALYNDGSAVGYDYVDDQDSYETAATMVTLDLSVGSRVWAQVLSSTVDARGGDRTLFTGFLINAHD